MAETTGPLPPTAAQWAEVDDAQAAVVAVLEEALDAWTADVRRSDAEAVYHRHACREYAGRLRVALEDLLRRDRRISALKRAALERATRGAWVSCDAP